jgi:2-polyprenyl-3-methyl-5-hydroxy-6-metoxy-1,4-benzoquinol methylase
MSSYHCRLCSKKNLAKLVELPNFPQAAQFFLSTEDDKIQDIAVRLVVVQCLSCGLIQLTNNPVHYFKDVITAASLSEGSKKNIKKEWLLLVDKYNLKNKQGIEIGAAKGDFLTVLNDMNVSICGLEHSEINISNKVSDKININQGYLLDLPNDFYNKYDFVVCNNYLEHQPDTYNFIAKLRDLLINDGMLYISVPNVEYLLSKSCLYEFVADHLVYFSKNSLTNALTHCSMEILELYTKNNGNDLVIVAQRRKPLDFKAHLEKFNNIVNSIKLFVKDRYKTGKKIAVWGAGHRALALMSISDLHEIECVVDSAAFKQNKLTPLLHKKIVSPENFIKLNCDVLIIMLPGNYAEQIIEFINSNKVKCEVIVFDDEVLNLH